MTRVITLLGKPSVDLDGVPRPPARGRKPWALLAYLVLTGRPQTRERLAEVLFGRADDPLGALRWNLAELRRLLDLPSALRGSEIRLDLPPSTVVDVSVLVSGSWTEGIALRGLGQDLLTGMTFSGDPIDDWLMLERSRLRAATASVLREAAAASLGTGSYARAVDFAARLVSLEPFDESGHELLIRGHVAAEQPDQAQAALDRCVHLFRAELGAEPGAAVTAAIHPGRATPSRPALASSASARAQLDLGQAAIAAGAVDTGLDSLRAAVADAKTASDDALIAEALFTLGHALVHAVRGRDGEAAALLHQALERSAGAEQAAIHAACHRELGYIDMLTAQYDRALRWLAQARSLTSDVPGTAWTLAYEAVCYSDTGRYAEALTSLSDCLAQGDETTIPNQTAYALCLLGRIQLLRGDYDTARRTLQRSLSIAEHHRWAAFMPWPHALLADVELRAGTATGASRDRLDLALDVAQRLGDPCWEGAALRGLALVDAQGGDVDSAVERLQEAARLCVRLPDGYVWMQAYTLDALCAVGTRGTHRDAPRWVADLTSLAARSGMKELLARAYLYRARLGDTEAARTAGLLADEVENSALDAPVLDPGSMPASASHDRSHA